MGYTDNVHTIMYYVQQGKFTILLLKELSKMNLKNAWMLCKRKIALHRENKNRLWLYRHLKAENLNSIRHYLNGAKGLRV